jgi:SNF2 family DNA or RNA helicase
MTAARNQPGLFDLMAAPYQLTATVHFLDGCIRLEWADAQSGAAAAKLEVRCTGAEELTWTLSGVTEAVVRSSHDRRSIRAQLRHFSALFPVNDSASRLGMVRFDGALPQPRPLPWELVLLPLAETPWNWLENQIAVMAAELGRQFAAPADFVDELAEEAFLESERYFRKQMRRVEKAEREAAERQRRVEAALARQRMEKRRREAEQRRRGRPAPATPPPPVPRPPLPPVPLTVELPSLQFQDTLLNLADLRRYFLLERARLWWVSNQADDLLSLPYCHLERLDYQIRTALRVIGPMRGRALLSDEVGLGKTIEAGLVIKEYLTRGMIKRFLVLTVPSLVDQWEEELEEKFHLACATTNHAAFRADPAAFWRENQAIIASLHTLKLPAHLAIAQQVNWDMLVVDEAHYLRNRAAQTWQAVNALPRQFLLLLTATPVQNSLADLHNLVTLLQPGQLPSPKEFQARFIDRKRPHHPREPEELRRLLGQIMIRNTRANAGINLPPRRAETVLVRAEATEAAFWQQWESELRAQLASLSASQASLWGRLLLQTAGSSPAAWRDALKSFPVKKKAADWSQQAPLEASWAKKCDLVVPPARSEGGVVIFTQYLETQGALAERLRAAGVPAWVINGQTPAAQRQPITDEFHRHAGALLLTHSGTEGRNLQFCHRLVNFDLPWNPMEIEQRIGRLHRIGQSHPVRIYNFVQQHTLQEHLLQILQDKLNLFELVVGETGLILGERFSSDEFAEAVFRRWRDSEGRVGEAMASLGEELAAARAAYAQVTALDETLFAKDYEAL